MDFLSRGFSCRIARIKAQRGAENVEGGSYWAVSWSFSPSILFFNDYNRDLDGLWSISLILREGEQQS